MGDVKAWNEGYALGYKAGELAQAAAHADCCVDREEQLITAKRLGAQEEREACIRIANAEKRQGSIPLGKDDELYNEACAWIAHMIRTRDALAEPPQPKETGR